MRIDIQLYTWKMSYALCCMYHGMHGTWQVLDSTDTPASWLYTDTHELIHAFIHSSIHSFIHACVHSFLYTYKRRLDMQENVVFDWDVVSSCSCSEKQLLWGTHWADALYMYVYVCICMYMYVYVCICMYLYVCMHACMYVCMCKCTHMCTYMCVCIYTCMSIRVYVKTYMCKRMHVYTYNFA